MKLYSIFDDFGIEPISVLQKAGIQVDIHPTGVPRPDSKRMEAIMQSYDGVIIGTSQKITEDMFNHIDKPLLIATASVGLDHISIPAEKRDLISVINTPKANSQSVAEYTIGCMLSCCKRLSEGNQLYRAGKDNKELSKKPEDVAGRRLGVIGAGNISKRIIEYGKMLGMDVCFWTANPQHHKDILLSGTPYIEIEQLLQSSDVISLNLPKNPETINFISKYRTNLIKNEAIFISVSRVEIIDVIALLKKAIDNPSFYLCLDIDVDNQLINQIPAITNVSITPHIAGGTIETRRRMFLELAEHIANSYGRDDKDV